MTTRELIEAVRDKTWYVPGPYSEELASNLHPVVKRADYDALVAATLAVLDAFLLLGPDSPDVDIDNALANARALREKLR